MDLIYMKMLTHGLYSRSGRNWAEEPTNIIGYLGRAVLEKDLKTES